MAVSRPISKVEDKHRMAHFENGSKMRKPTLPDSCCPDADKGHFSFQEPNHPKATVDMKWGATGRYLRANPKRAWLAPPTGFSGTTLNVLTVQNAVAHWANGTRHQEERLGKASRLPVAQNSVVRPTGTCTWTFKGLQPSPRMAEHQNNNNINHDRRPDTGPQQIPTTNRHPRHLDLCHLF